MAALPASALRMTPAEYLAWDDAHEDKHEYFYGEVYETRAMSGGTARHARLGANVIGALVTALRGKGCQVYSSDLRVQTDPDGHYVYPDVTVVCGEALFASVAETTLVNPTLVVEVLSPSSEAYDRGRKAQAYRRVPSLHEIVLVAQDRRSVEVLRREGERWVLLEAQAETLDLAIGGSLSLDEVYEGVQTDAEREADAEREGDALSA